MMMMTGHKTFLADRTQSYISTKLKYDKPKISYLIKSGHEVLIIEIEINI